MGEGEEGEEAHQVDAACPRPTSTLAVVGRSLAAERGLETGQVYDGNPGADATEGGGGAAGE